MTPMFKIHYFLLYDFYKQCNAVVSMSICVSTCSLNFEVSQNESVIHSIGFGIKLTRFLKKHFAGGWCVLWPRRTSSHAWFVFDCPFKNLNHLCYRQSYLTLTFYVCISGLVRSHIIEFRLSIWSVNFV